MRKFLITTNIIIGVILIALTWMNYRDNYELELSYDAHKKDTELLIKEYNDSTSADQRTFSQSDLLNYASKLDNDSLINFVIRQEHQRDYFSGYHHDLNAKLDHLNVQLILKRRNFYILSTLTLIIFAVNLTLLLKYKQE